MKIVAKQLLVASCVFGLFVGVVQAQDPTFSLMVSAINGVEQDPLLSTVDADPGDILEVLILVRDWSEPAGQKLRGYEAVIDYFGYLTGSAGDVYPVDFAETTDLNGRCTAGGDYGLNNNANAIVDTGHVDPDYILLGLPSVIVAIDTLSCDYRFSGSLIFPGPNAPLSVPGVKYYGGELYLEVSADASGTFTVGFKEPNCLLRDEYSGEIVIGAFEDLTILVDVVITPTASVPPNDAVDAGKPTDLYDLGVVYGWDEIDIEFGSDASSVSASDFTVTVDPPDTTAPSVASISSVGNVATLSFDMMIPVTHWTVVTYDPTGWSTRVGYLPGDSNGDGTNSTVDILDLIDHLNGVITLPAWNTDVDRSGATNSADILTVIDLFNGAGLWDPWLGQALP